MMQVEPVIETNEPPKAESAKTTELSVEGMTCGNCARHVTEALQSVAGVHSAMVSLDSRRALVRWSPTTAQNPGALVEAVRQAGYDSKAITEDQPAADVGVRKLAGWQLTLWIGVAGTLPLMLGEWAFGLSTTPWFRW